MFDIGWGELVVIGVVALVAIGPKELPGALRSLGHWMGKIRRMAAEFQNQFQEALREAEMADLKKQVESLTAGLDPIEATRREIEGAVADIPKLGGERPSWAVDRPPSAVPGAAPEAGGAIASDAPSALAPAPASGTPAADVLPPETPPVELDIAPSPPSATATREPAGADAPRSADAPASADVPGSAKPGDPPA